MGRGATKAAGNVWYEARMEAAKWNDKLLSRAGAAEALNMSEDAVKDAELGYSDAELLEAARNYAAQCKKLKTEKQYIKHPKTFLSESLPFLDFIPKKTQPEVVETASGENPFLRYRGDDE